MHIRLSWNLDIDIRLSSNFLMDISLSFDLGINIRLGSDFLMNIRLSFNLDINVWLSKRVQVSVCYGRIIMSSINSSYWGMSIGNRLSSITVCVWASSIGTSSDGSSSGVSISSRVTIPSWDNTSTCG